MRDSPVGPCDGAEPTGDTGVSCGDELKLGLVASGFSRRGAGASVVVDIAVEDRNAFRAARPKWFMQAAGVECQSGARGY